MNAPTGPLAPDGRPHAVVIGSGFGGLAAAIRLGARGYRVTVLERLDEAGGRAAVFRQDGFTFDAGPTIITAPFLFEELWQLCGRRMADNIDLRALEPFYRIRFDDGSTFSPTSDSEGLRREVARIAPSDLAGFDDFMRVSEAACRVGFEQLGNEPFQSFSLMLKQAPMLMKLEAYRSIYGLVARHIRNEKLRTALSFHPLLIGGNPFRAPGIYSLIPHLEKKWGVHFAMGGTGALVAGLVSLIRGQGNEIRFSQDVAEIVVAQGRATGVRLSDGQIIAADVVVSNADSAWTYGRLLRGARRRRWSDAKLGRARYSMGLFLWYFGTKVQYRDVSHHTILLGPRYRGLLGDIFDRRVLADDFSLYLHRPTATDPSLAPEGCDTFYVLSPVPNLGGDVDWAEQAELYRRRIATHLQRTVLPGLADAVVTSRVMTPLDFRDRLNAPLGAAFGLEPILTQSAWFRPHNRSEEVANLYLVGAGTHPGAGLPGVLSSARILDKVVPDARILA